MTKKHQQPKDSKGEQPLPEELDIQKWTWNAEVFAKGIEQQAESIKSLGAF